MHTHWMLYGGSFNPPHAGHIHTVRTALTQLPATRCLVVPAGTRPWKPQFNPQARYEMTKAAFGGVDRVEVSDVEVNRAEAGPTYTYDTVEQLRAAGYKVTRLLVGADQLEALEHWYRLDDLLDIVDLVVMPRRGCGIRNLPVGAMVLPGTSTPETSSTQIRHHLETGGEVADLVTVGLLPAGVAEIIQQARLYQTAA